MDIWDALRIVGRRWYVAVPILLVFVALAVIASGRVDAEYKAEASLVLLAPNQTPPDSENPEPQGYNPWLAACSSCEQIGQALSLTLESNDEKQVMQQAGWSPDYVIEPQTRSALVHLQASSRDPDDAVGTVDALIDRVAAELETLQADANAPQNQRITVSVLSQEDTATGNTAAASRVRLALLAAGFILAFLAAFAVEGGVYVLEQRRRRGGRPPDHAEAPVAGDDRVPSYGDNRLPDYGDNRVPDYGDEPVPSLSDDPGAATPVSDAPDAPVVQGSPGPSWHTTAWPPPQQGFNPSGRHMAGWSPGARRSEGQD